MNLRSNWEWACDFTGDPDSFTARGEAFLEFLIEEGLKQTDNVLELGCGNLSQGAPLIRYLGHNRYFGVEPAGWLVNAGLERFPDLASKGPRFLWRSDFAVAEDTIEPFQFVLAHSVLSHVAHWQMSQALYETRKVVEKGAIWLASVRLDQYDDFAPEWAYPGVNKFRLETIEALAFHAGWAVTRKTGYEDRLQAVAPNDTHQILRLEAVRSPQEAHEMTTDMDARKRENDELRELAKELREKRERERLAKLSPGWMPSMEGTVE